MVDAQRIASEANLGTRINTVMQVCFFALSGVLPVDQAIAAIKGAVESRPTGGAVRRWSIRTSPPSTRRSPG